MKIILTLAAAVSLAVGVGSASASGGRHGGRHVILSFSPASPVAGEQFSISFSLIKDGVKLRIANPGCLGMTKGRPIPLASISNDGTTGTCTWNIPTKAGPTFDGELAFFDEQGGEWFAGYDRLIG
jgi:hypothetical protein